MINSGSHYHIAGKVIGLVYGHGQSHPYLVTEPIFEVVQNDVVRIGGSNP